MYIENEDRGPNIPLMMAQLRVDANLHRVFLMKDEGGNFYAPHIRNGFNTIPFWNLEEGYQVKIRAGMDTTATWIGSPIPADAPISIDPGWNMIAYFPTYELQMRVDPQHRTPADIDFAGNFYAIAEIKHDFRIIKDVSGNFAAVTANLLFSNMPNMRMTQGYQINITSEDAVVLHYSPEQEQQAAVTLPVEVEQHWTSPVRTGSNMSVLVESVAGFEASSGDQLAAFNTEGVLVGVGRFTEDGMGGVAVWGDDASTEEVEGMLEGESFTLRMWDVDTESDLSVSVLDVQRDDDQSGVTYKTNSFLVVKLGLSTSIIPEDFYLSQAYPNPFNAITRVRYGLPEGADVSVQVFDVAGRLVATLVDGEQTAGYHVIAWDSHTSASGIYLIRMEAAHFSGVTKVTLLK
jgi:hypothetical protein